MLELDVLPALLPRTSVALGSWCDSWRVVRMGLSDPHLTIIFPDVSCACNRGGGMNPCSLSAFERLVFKSAILIHCLWGRS